MDSRTLSKIFLGVLLCIVIAKSTDSKCPGPLQYYKDLGCKPIFNKSDDSCALRYDCDKFDNLPRDKCFVNDHSYDIGDELREEDANPCDIDCTCREGHDGTAAFQCAIVDCFDGEPMRPGCYRRGSPLQCCSGDEICPENPSDRATCIVDGKTYLDGEYFADADDPDKTCICQPRYAGKNVEPFCAKPKHPYCDPMFQNPSDVRNHCAPVYYISQSPQTDCSVFSRCQNDEDKVIAKSASGETANSNMRCEFGTMTMQIGDELNQATDYNSVCVKCVCEVPPTPTCQRLPDEECDVTRHKNFHKR